MYRITGSKLEKVVGQGSSNLEEAKQFALSLKIRGFINVTVQDRDGNVLWTPDARS